MSGNSSQKPLIFVVTDTEQRAFDSIFTRETREFICDVAVEHGHISGRPVAFARILEMGSRGTESIPYKIPALIQALQPSIVMEAGICFGLKDDFPIGRVGICQHTTDYEYQKINNDGVQYRTRTLRSDPSFYSKMMSFIASATEGSVDAKGANYACGDKVVNSDDFKRSVRNAAPDSSCGDMESFALATACESSHTPWIVVKASSDDGVNKGDEHQIAAALASAKFIEEFFSSPIDLDHYFKIRYEVELRQAQNFASISKEIFGQEPDIQTSSNNKRDIFEHHLHPDLGHGWIIAYISKAHSIPLAIRSIVKSIPEGGGSRVDVCIASTKIASQSIESYEKLLNDLGVKNAYVAPIDKFIYKRIVEKRTFESTSTPPPNYVDQMVFRDGEPLKSGRSYAKGMLSQNDSGRSDLRPITVVLGQGGVGKTTFCSNLVNYINSSTEFSKRVLLMTKSDIMKNYSGEPIKSIADLYREYVRGLDTQTGTITTQGFSVAMSCGSIVLMVDGIDEIESALADRFDMPSFVDSISSLNKALESCRVILTSRDVSAPKFATMSNAEIIFLKGFSESDVDEYLGKESHEKSKLKEIARKIKDPDGLVNPYLLHVARQHLIDNIGSETSDDGDIKSDALSSTSPFDYILARSIQREIIKQSLNIEIDDYFLLLCEIAVEHENSMKRDAFDDYIEIAINEPRGITNQTGFSDRYLKFFLLNQTEDRISVSHPEYVSRILINRLSTVFSMDENQGDIRRSRIVDRILGNRGNDVFSIRELLCSNLAVIEVSKPVAMERIREEISVTSSNIATARQRKINYELHLLAFDLNKPTTPQEHRDVLASLHAPNLVSNLVVLGKFPRIDYSSLTVEKSIFHGHVDFLKGIFNKETRFRKCSFQNCSAKYNISNADKTMFETCDMDENLRDLLGNGESKKADTKDRAKTDARQILKSMRKGLGFQSTSFNRIKSYSALSSDRSYDEFLALMVEHGILSIESNIYVVRKTSEGDAIALCEDGHAQGIIKSFLKKFMN